MRLAALCTSVGTAYSLCSGCIGGVGPDLAYGVQATEHGPKSAGVQLGVEAGAGLPIAEGTGGGAGAAAAFFSTAGRGAS